VIAELVLKESIFQMRKLKDLADKAIAQTDDQSFFAVLDNEANSVALLMKHMSGNMESRWRDFLTTDGEKATRNREAEFEQQSGDTREAVQRAWEDGWNLLFATLSSLAPDDLTKTVRIRGEMHTVLEAIQRQLTHYAQHVGQIVMLAKHYAGPRWHSLSIPRGKSKEVDVSKSGTPYRH
jgi:hypothetical protein